MGGLIFLLVIGLWLALCIYLARKIPRWLGMRRFGWILALLLFPVLLAAPVVDEVIGMRQFEQLCKERAVMHVSPEASQVKRAQHPNLAIANLPGYWIKIESQPISYIDIDTGKPFVTYEGLHTKGGRVAGIALMGGTHSCWPKDASEVLKRLNIDKLLKEGQPS